MGDGGRAAVLVLAAIAALAQAPDAQLAEAMKLAARGDNQKAAALLEDLSRRQPENAEVRYRFGVVLLRAGDFAAAARELDAASQLQADAAPVWLALVQTRLRLGENDAAVRAAGKAAAAISAAEPNTPPAQAARLRQLLGQAYRMANKPAEAVEQMQHAIRLDPAQRAYYAELAQLFLHHRTPEPAVAVLEPATARFPEDAELLRLLGLAYYSEGKLDRATQTFLRVTDLKPDDEAGYASLETLLPDAGAHLDGIIKRLRGFAERNPSNPLGHYLLAQALTARHSGTQEAEPLLRKAIARDPKFWPAWFELHKPLLEAGKIEEAARSLATAVELNPEFAPARYSLAQVYAQMGNREGAKEQRRIHHELTSRQRDAAEARRAEAPMLPYRVIWK